MVYPFWRLLYPVEKCLMSINDKFELPRYTVPEAEDYKPLTGLSHTITVGVFYLFTD